MCFYRSLDQLVSLIDSLSGSIHVDKEVKEEAAEEQEVEQEEADRYPEGEETGDQEKEWSGLPDPPTTHTMLEGVVSCPTYVCH